MPSDTEPRKMLPKQVIVKSSEPEGVIITLDSATRDDAVAKGKKEAGKPLYLKRV
jgi:hypothetical protein